MTCGEMRDSSVRVCACARVRGVVLRALGMAIVILGLIGTTGARGVMAGGGTFILTASEPGLVVGHGGACAVGDTHEATTCQVLHGAHLGLTDSASSVVPPSRAKTETRWMPLAWDSHPRAPDPPPPRV